MKWTFGIWVVIALCTTGCPTQGGSQRPSEGGLLFDGAGIVQQADELRRVLEHYRNQFGVELVIATVESSSGMEINPYAQKLFSEWRIGENYGGKGILLLVSNDTGEGRLEISYELEHILTDLMCGRIIRNQVRPFWEMDMIYVGMLDAVFLISERSRMLSFDRSTAAEKARLEDEFLSGGGGVTLPVRFDLGYEAKARLSGDDRLRYGPGRTPLETVEEFRSAMSSGINDNTLGMYTPQTQVFFRMEPTLTREYRTYAEIISKCGPFRINSDGTRAVVQMQESCKDRFPIFCLKNREGWQLDWVTFFHSHGRELKGGWTMHRIPTGYEHLIPGTKKVAQWCSRLPVRVDQKADFRRQVGEAEQQLKIHPNSPDHHLQLADLYLSCWRWPDALRLYSRAVALSPDDPRYLAALAEAKYYLYFMKSARKNFQKLRGYPQWRSRSAIRLKEIQRWLGDG
jgi:uncharacterized protein